MGVIGNVGAYSGQLLASVGTAGSTNTGVSTGLEDSDTTETHHADEIADASGVVARDGLLVITV